MARKVDDRWRNAEISRQKLSKCRCGGDGWMEGWTGKRAVTDEQNK
jgi:hypothetical protein